MLDALADAPARSIARPARGVTMRRRFRLRGEVPAFGRKPLHHPRRHLVEKARSHVVTQLAVQHATLRMREIQPAPGARDCDVREAALFLDAIVFAEAVLVREQPFLEPGDEYRMELETLCSVHGHQLQR